MRIFGIVLVLLVLGALAFSNPEMFHGNNSGPAASPTSSSSSSSDDGFKQFK